MIRHDKVTVNGVWSSGLQFRLQNIKITMLGMCGAQMHPKLSAMTMMMLGMSHGTHGASFYAI
ncbi:MAG: hypothetical protein EX263_13800 [Flavobacteriaceae bacterium]|nr:MAG: hypothetical protein EX263_13800 [Flavobacteriaceae bacterium]